MDGVLVQLSNRRRFPRVNLVENVEDGFVLLACEIDRRPPFAYFLESTKKRKLTSELKRSLSTLQRAVEEATLLKAVLIPPGRGAYLKRRPDAHIARFDLAMLLRTRDVQSAEQTVRSAAFQSIITEVGRSAHFVYLMVGKNVRRMGPVDHGRNGIFLLNYFFAGDVQQNLNVFEYTAGWFQNETDLDNSVLMQPVQEYGAHYTVINHARWDGLANLMPSLIFKPSFRRYVLKHFEVNNTAAMPILYKLA